jgi:LPPG:FO 2-phospho-L-lactate transferase
VRTIVATDAGELAFQDYFVRRRCEPIVRAVRFEGAGSARPLDAVLALLASPQLDAVVICPSNPYLSIDPMLAMPGLRSALLATAAPVIAVSPIIGGEAVKGPTAKIMRELGIESSAASVVRHYRGLLDGVVLDDADAGLVPSLGVPTEVASTWMRTLEDRERLARTVLGFAARLRAEAGTAGAMSSAGRRKP